MTDINKYGCFQVKILSSIIEENNGKIAWTCEYYMEGKTEIIEEYKKITKSYYNDIRKDNSTFKVNVEELKLNNSTFTNKLGIVYFGDKLEQLTSINKYGCFQIKVISSKDISNNGKIAWACKKYLK
ncbi:MAG: hypothetical protein Q9M97_09345 [Candidatus Gracilibacteria bacterium]|nr:hypothetical protein [Candidatus Gracilibacteria bacterium]